MSSGRIQRDCHSMVGRYPWTTGVVIAEQDSDIAAN